MSLVELEELCVTRFPLSQTRASIFAGLQQVIAKIVETGISCTLWLNGSFLTDSIDPQDIDLVALIPAHFCDDGTDEQRNVFDWLTSTKNQPKQLYLCDTHAEPIYPDDSPLYYLVPDALKYWRSIYGKAVESGAPKGIAVVHIQGSSA